MKKYIVALVALMAVLASCNPKIIKEIEYKDSIRIEYKTKIDSFKYFSTDSVVVKNDSIIWRFKTIYKERTKVDTTFKEVIVYKDKLIESEKKLTFWEKIKIRFGGYAIIATIISILLVAFRVYKKYFLHL